MFHSRLLFRQLTRPDAQIVIYVLCVLLAAAGISTVHLLRHAMAESLNRDSQALHGGDLMVQSHFPLTETILAATRRLEDSGRLNTARVWELSGMARSPLSGRSALADLKIVDAGYPLYGEVQLASGRPLSTVLVPGTVIAAPALLARLGLTTGDPVVIGGLTAVAADEIIAEPDRPAGLFSFGPRMLIHHADLERLALVGTASRVHSKILIRVHDPSHVDDLAGELRAASPSGQEQVETFRTAKSRLRRFLDHFLFFLNLCGVFILFLAGIGISTSLGAAITVRETSIAVMKAMGADHRFILKNFLALVLLLGGVGASLGGLAGEGIAAVLLAALADLLVRPESAAPPHAARLLAAATTLSATLLFSAIPLTRLREQRPSAIFQQQRNSFLSVRGLGRDRIILTMLVFVFLAGLIFVQMREARIAVALTASLFVLGGCAAMLALAMLALLRRARPKSLALRIALRGVFRPRSQSFAFLATTTVSMALLLFITLVEESLIAQYVDAYPPDSPNVFVIDIQKEQTGEFLDLAGTHAELHPLVRARLLAVNGKPVDPEREFRRRGDHLARPFNLTYRSTLLPDEALLAGPGLFDLGRSGIQVSVLDTVAELADMTLGDRLHFDLQGIPLEAEISSIRTRQSLSITPFFYFVFQPKDLAGAPQTHFAALRVPPGEIASLQDRLANRLPNLSLIDLTDSVRVFARIMHKMTTLIRSFMVLSLLAGGLILLGSICATRRARLAESVFLKLGGATRGFLHGVFALEHLALAAGSAAAALLLALVAADLTCRFHFEIPFTLRPSLLVGGFLIHAATLVLVSVITLRRTCRQRPADLLREVFHE